MPHSTVAALALVAATFATAAQDPQPGPSPTDPPTRTTLPEGGVTVLLVPGHGLPTVDVYVGAAGPYRFIVEWAGNVLAVSERVRDEADLEPVGRSPHGSALVAVPGLAVGDAVVEGMTADVAPFLSETEHDGVLGLNVFHELVGVLDFPAGELRLSQEPLPDPAEDDTVLAYSPGPGGTPRIPIELNGEPFQAVLDTAAESALIVDDRFLDRLGIVGELRDGPMIMTPAMGRMQAKLGRIAGELVIGTTVTEEPLALFHRMQEPEILLGGGFLRDYALTLDQRSRRLRLERPSRRSE